VRSLGLEGGEGKGVKCGVVDERGKVVDRVMVYLDEEKNMLGRVWGVIKEEGVKVIGMGKGTVRGESEKSGGEV
ncbi:hypothetical protein, partial [Neisseria sicca]|uniref:hypothetical protein n=1 Tax=Neisseria sicca TaxID=490 RepID=UPI001649998F